MDNEIQNLINTALHAPATGSIVIQGALFLDIISRMENAEKQRNELLKALKDEHSRSFTRIGNISFCRWNNANSCKVCNLIAKAGDKT